LCKKLDNPGIKVNLDVGTLIYNDESIQLKENIELVNHVHISEPYLAPIEKRQLHRDLINELRNLNYEQFLSIEIANPNNIELIKENVLYVKELCHEI
jgi:sugar phosphate isomerase/epimerase